MGVLRLLDPTLQANSVYDKAIKLLEEQVFLEPKDWYEPGDIPDLPMFNDRKSHAEVLALWDKTIAAQWAKEEPARPGYDMAGPVKNRIPPRKTSVLDRSELAGDQTASAQG